MDRIKPKFIEGKWGWMMQWCRKQRLAPANSSVWAMAEKEYNLAHPHTPEIEPYVYCVESDEFGLTYHRFTREDYEELSR